MPEEPVVKRTCVFIDGQNLYWAARHAFGYHYPNYDPLPLAQAVTQSREWNLDTIHFYTGLPDKKLSEVVDEVRHISIQQNRWIKVACAFPVSPTSVNKRGINGTDWIPIDRKTYDSCLDKNDYRPK